MMTNKKIPTRVQRKRKKGSKLPANTLCCTRHSQFSNPLVGKDAAKFFRLWLMCQTQHNQPYSCWSAAALVGYARIGWVYDVQLHKSVNPYQTAERYLNNLEKLREYDHLGCWCGLDDDCHVDTYLELLAGGDIETGSNKQDPNDD